MRRTTRLLMMAFALALAGCASMTSPEMGTEVTGPLFEQEVVGRVMSFRLGAGRLAEAQFLPDGTVLYSGDALNGVGRWRTWDKGYCAYYPRIGAGPALGRTFSGPSDVEGFRCYIVRASDGAYVVFQPDGTFVGTLIPLR